MSSSLKLDFDDVLIAPQFSDINSRKEVALINLPVMNANMRSIATEEFVDKFSYFGGVACSHRFQPFAGQLRQYRNAQKFNGAFWCSVGITDKEYDTAEALVRNDCKHICIDVAHAAQQQTIDFIEKLSKLAEINIMVGNFGSPVSVFEFFQRLSPHSKKIVKAVKLGVGPGSMCRTRSVTGVGYPQISLISETKSVLGDETIIVADGGMKTTGDIAKALAAGADMVMSGSLFKNCNLTDSVYRGSASAHEYKHQHKDGRAPEGVESIVESNEKIEDIVDNIRMSLASSFSYVGARNIKEFRDRARLITISSHSKTL